MCFTQVTNEPLFITECIYQKHKRIPERNFSEGNTGQKKENYFRGKTDNDKLV